MLTRVISHLVYEIFKSKVLNALDQLSNWVTAYCLEVNRNKTALILFTTKAKIPTYGFLV